MSELVSFSRVVDILKNAESIAITSHIHPDGDAIGSSLAMFHALQSLGKSARILINDDVPDCFSILEGAQSIERNSELKFDLVLLLDTRINRSGGICEKINAPILNIDHHVSNDRKADWLLLEPTVSSTCEIVFKLFVDQKIPVTSDIAMCLYTGIATDTGFFRFSNTTHSAMSICAELIRLGAKPELIADSISTKTFRELQLMTNAMRTIELFFDGRAIGIFLDRELSELVLTDELIDMIRFTAGVDIAFLLRYEYPNAYRLRMRSRRTDITKITEQLGGGGHKHAAGATIHGSLDEVKRMVLNVVADELQSK